MARYINPKPQIIDGDNKIIVNAKKFLFFVGTTTKKTIYSDDALSVARANPVLSDSNGRFPAIFLDGLYKEEQQDNSGTLTGYDGVTLWTEDPIGAVSEGPFELWAADRTYDIPNIVLASDGEYYRSLTDSNKGNNPISSPGNWEKVQFNRIWNINVSYLLGESVVGSDGFYYMSTVTPNLGNNPVSDSDNWRPPSSQFQMANATGTADAITATFAPALTVLNDNATIIVRSLGANTIINPTFSPNGLTTRNIVKNGNQALDIGDIPRAGYEMMLKYNLANLKWELMNKDEISLANLPAGTVVQVAQTESGAVATGATVVPYDDTIPQKTEGDQYFSVSISPKFSNSILHFRFVGNFASSVSGSQMAVSLFKGSNSSAIAVASSRIETLDQIYNIALHHSEISGGVASETYTIRAGGHAGATTLNGIGTTNRRYGGVLISGLTITEVKV